ncbi:hypothetical protein GIY62_06235 [Burkholderia plantarii]|uniref:hypothetical protein n=1 Tax=Burkholderia plantarii TaxID=41899 RepID=UPI002729E970|nr:hypothetical protein [Burkholderia plantarii]WLE60256.1 hypothetical protein GIY62_06235 [Burkholderia plantarii]
MYLRFNWKYQTHRARLTIHALGVRARRLVASHSVPADFSWDLKPHFRRVLESGRRFARARRIARVTFRASIYMLALLGAFFLYLLIHGYGQYTEARDNQAATCAVSRCA